MPGRKIPLITDEFYHVFNRGINHQDTFYIEADYKRALDSISLYRFSNPPLCLSKFIRLNTKKRAELLNTMGKSQVSILSYCLMPNHFHLLLRQDKDEGISKLLGNFLNSYTKYFNIRHDRDGSLFLDQFKAVRIENSEQLHHTCRYIHLNPYSSRLVTSLENLSTYPWSSLCEYLGDKQGKFVDKQAIMASFSNKEKFRQFTFDHADQQRKLKEIEHLLIE